MKRRIAVFDFDGTITSKDTFIEFILFSKGMISFGLGLVLYSPYIIAFKLGLYPNYKAKEKLFAYFFKGMKFEDFKNLGEVFSNKTDNIIRESTRQKIKDHINKCDDIFVISASIEEWVRPWCMQNGIKNVLCTKIEVDSNGYITGKFLTKNCYGQEKVNRLLELEPNREEYYLYAYGDSRGDKEIIEFADKGEYIK